VADTHTRSARLRKNDLLDREAVTSLGQLELISTRVVEGFVTGKHRSPFKGSTADFAEHRPYSPGDEARLLDWRVYAKRDRYYIKQFEEVTNLRALLVIDASGSMGFGLSTPTKLRYALTAAACLARMVLHQQDAVGTALIDTAIRRYIPPRANPSHLHVLLEEWSQAHPGGDTSLADVLHDLAKRIRRRGMLMIFSDCFDDLDALTRALHHLHARGHEVLVFHTMAPEELSFSFNRWSRFQCLEQWGRRIDLDPAAVRERYLERVGRFLDELKSRCAEIKSDYVPLTTDRPLTETLGHYLRWRARRTR